MNENLKHSLQQLQSELVKVEQEKQQMNIQLKAITENKENHEIIGKEKGAEIQIRFPNLNL